MAIRFYSARARPYGCFSNFSPHGFDLDGLHWPTSEHYFQAQKFAGTPAAERVRVAPTPTRAAAIGRDRSLPLRPDWERVKDSVMLRAVLRKFEANSEIREVLLATGDEPIIEDAPRDAYWGCGADGTGKNRLGAILMAVRAILRTGNPLAAREFLGDGRQPTVVAPPVAALPAQPAGGIAAAPEAAGKGAAHRDREAGHVRSARRAAFVHNGDYHLADVAIFADGRVDCWGVVDFEGFRRQVREGRVVTRLPEGARVQLAPLGAFTASEVWNDVPEADFVAEIRDVIETLNGRPTSADRCRTAWDRFSAEPSADNRQALRSAYEAIPGHLRGAIFGDQDAKDFPIREALYGPEGIPAEENA